MKKYEVISSLVWTSVGISFCIGSITMGLGSLTEPGPGFFPFVMSACLIFFSLIHFISWSRKGGQFNSTVSKRFWPETAGIKRIVLVNVFLLLFVFALNYLGFLLSTLLFMFCLLRFIEPQKWVTVFLTTGLFTSLSYIIFQVWLRSNLPRGFLGF